MTVVAAAALSSLVRLEHTLFALPYAYVGAIFAVDGRPALADLVWITVAMAGARSLAMAAEPPGRRRDRRAQPAHRPPRDPGRAAVAHAGDRASASCRWRSSRWPSPSSRRSRAGWRRSRSSPFVIYPYLKRFTPLCHLWLGAVDGLAPVGAWVAITERRRPEGVPARRRVVLLDRRVRRHLRDDGLRARSPRGPPLASRPTTASPRASRSAGSSTRWPSCSWSRAGIALGVGVIYWLGVVDLRRAARLRECDREAGRPVACQRRLLQRERDPRGDLPGRRHRRRRGP